MTKHLKINVSTLSETPYNYESFPVIASAYNQGATKIYFLFI
jgi:hypothetical protein